MLDGAGCGREGHGVGVDVVLATPGLFDVGAHPVEYVVGEHRSLGAVVRRVRGLEARSGQPRRAEQSNREHDEGNEHLDDGKALCRTHRHAPEGFAQSARFPPSRFGMRSLSVSLPTRGRRRVSTMARAPLTWPLWHTAKAPVLFTAPSAPNVKEDARAGSAPSV